MNFNYNNGNVSFRQLPQRKQFKALDQLITSANERKQPTEQVETLSRDLGLRNPAYLEVGLIEAGEDLDKPGAGDGVTELAEALGLREGVVDKALGKYVASLAKDTDPRQQVHYGGNT